MAEASRITEHLYYLFLLKKIEIHFIHKDKVAPSTLSVHHVRLQGPR